MKTAQIQTTTLTAANDNAGNAGAARSVEATLFGIVDLLVVSYASAAANDNSRPQSRA